MFQGMTIGEQRTLLGLAVVIAVGLGAQRYRDYRENPPLVVKSDQSAMSVAAIETPAVGLPVAVSTPIVTITPAPTATPLPIAQPVLPSPPDRFSGRLNLNRATQEELDRLPGIGPKRSQQILEYRTRSGGFRAVEDLLAIDGIGEKTLETLRPLVGVE